MPHITAAFGLKLKTELAAITQEALPLLRPLANGKQTASYVPVVGPTGAFSNIRRSIR